ncbi:MAG: putative PEP-binding protein, partial [Leptolyngbyaceae bacterium]|nr:putative PEP-binding protein [Leptolyngbyaceae bacterium]
KDFVDISASWGLLHGLQTGDVVPDRYYTYEDSQVTHQHISTKRYAYTLHLPTTPTQAVLSDQAVSSPVPEPMGATSPSAPTALELSTDYRHRHMLADQEAQQGILPRVVVGDIRRLSQELRQIVGIALCVEWSIHSLAVEPPPVTTHLPWSRFADQRVFRHDELAQSLEEKRCVLQVTYLFPQKSKGLNVPPIGSSRPRANMPHFAAASTVGIEPATSDLVVPDPLASEPIPSESMISASSSLKLSTLKPSTLASETPDLEFSPLPLQDSTSPASTPILKGLGASGGQVTAPVWVVQEVSQLAEVESIDRYILVTQNITFSWFSVICRVQGLVSEQGGVTSHGAILSREVGIPAVVGVGDALTALKTGDWVILDGDRGTITPIPPSATATPIASTSAGNKMEPAGLPALTPATQLMLSLSQPDRLDTLAQLPVNGVGLIRSELMITSMLQHQSLQRWLQADQRPRFLQTLAELIQQFAQAFAPRPIWYRTMDLRSHEYPQTASLQALPEPNPLLGYHGPMGYQLDPTLFLTELNALKQVQDHGLDNVNILLPFVRTVEEFQFCYEAIQQTGWSAQGQGQVWIMAEVPSVLFLLSDYVAAGVQGIAIGSNDLNHLLLALDRTTSHQGLGPTHPAVLRAIQSLITTARKANIPCTLCGDLASQHPELVESFIRWGITALSVEPNAVAQAQASIRQAEWQLFQEWQRDRFSR